MTAFDVVDGSSTGIQVHIVIAVEAITIERSHPCKRLQQLV